MSCSECCCGSVLIVSGCCWLLLATTCLCLRTGADAGLKCWSEHLEQHAAAPLAVTRDTPASDRAEFCSTHLAANTTISSKSLSSLKCTLYHWKSEIFTSLLHIWCIWFMWINSWNSCIHFFSSCWFYHYLRSPTWSWFSVWKSGLYFFVPPSSLLHIFDQSPEFTIITHHHFILQLILIDWRLTQSKTKNSTWSFHKIFSNLRLYTSSFLNLLIKFLCNLQHLLASQAFDYRLNCSCKLLALL